MLWMLVRLPPYSIVVGQLALCSRVLKKCGVAGATRIDVRLEGGGLKSVEVR